MFIIDFKSSYLEGFTHGFVKGLAAPVMLHHREDVPAIPPLVYVQAQTQSVEKSIAQDWMRTGEDIYQAIRKNEPAQEEALTSE